MSQGRWDLRSTALAAGAWAGAAAGWLIGWWAPLAAGAAGALMALTRGPRRLLLLAAVAGMVGGCVAALGSAARQPPELLVGTTAEVIFQVETDGRQLEPLPGRDPQLLMGGTLVGARRGSSAWRLDLPARLVVAASTWRGCGSCSPGARVRLYATVDPREPTDPLVRLRAASPPSATAPAGGVAALAASVRAGLREVTAGAPSDAASLVSGLALGDESGQDPRFAETMRTAGLSHLTAVSGGNIVIVLLLVLLPLRRLGVPVPGQAVAGGAAVAAYVLLVGPQPSVLRAAALACAGLAGVLLGGPARGAPVLFGVTFLLLIFVPELALSLGFGLSVAATAGLQLIAPPLARRLRRLLPDWLALAFAVTVAAQLTSAPILLAAGTPASWVAVPANLAAAPLVAPITVFGLAAALFAPVASPAAVLMATVAAAPAELLAVIARLAAATAAAPWGDALIRSVAAVSAAAAGTAMAFGARRHRPTRGVAGTALLVLAVVLVMAPWRGSDVPDDWRVVACDVGQGAAVLLRTRDAAVLVDTGPAGGRIADCLRESGVARLDAVVLTHPHADHVGALGDVLDTVPVGELIAGPGRYPREGVAAVASQAGRHGLAFTEVSAGHRLRWAGLDVDVLWPRPGDVGSADDVNNTSLVLLGQWPDGASVLAPGDVEPEAQRRIVDTWQPPDVDVAVVPHHGSDHQDPRFAAWAAPAAAVASAGAGNSYGHPDGGTLAEYAALGAAVHRTDLAGTVAYAWRDGTLVVSGG